MAKKQLVVNRPATLDSRPTDVDLRDDQYTQISLFAQLKQKPSLDKFPGTLKLRRFRKGEVLCRQGEAGWTAFYVLTSEDVAKLIEKVEPGTWRKGAAESGKIELSRVRERMSMIEVALDEESKDEARKVATVHLSVAIPNEGPKRGFLSRLFGGSRSQQRERPAFIPIDGPRDIDYETMQAPICEGEIFGEMSCLYLTPRSATIVVNRDCYMLEMLRNILDQLQKDAGFKALNEELVKKRIFQMHLRNLSVFADLSDDQYQAIRDKIELKTYNPGELICDEHERADGVYVIRSGLVRVVKKVSALLHNDSIRSWGGLCTALREGEQQPGTPRAKVWEFLAAPVRALIVKGGAGQLSSEQRQEVLFGLNEVLKNKMFGDAKEFAPIVATDKFKELVKEMGDKKRMKEMDLRRYHRYILEGVFPGVIRDFRPRVGPDRVLSYLSRGEFIGEMGVLNDEPRIATCFAFSHPVEGGKASGRVELVRIPAADFARILKENPIVREKVEQKAVERERQSAESAKQAIWEENDALQSNEQFEKLGLVQGQRLMLIDLDRCTRCDECVKACVNTHDDGRSRLFLDGPRFSHYLVPVSCRSCLDPVCMIGCPVGSIHRGDKGQMLIEDWCIGCGLCSNNCPYGSIQMYDIGVIPEAAMGWAYMPSAAVKGDGWQAPGFSDHKWLLGTAPFYNYRELQGHLKDVLGNTSGGSAPICMRYTFNLSSYLLKPESVFKMEVTSTDDNIQVWVNGQEMKNTDKPKRGKREHLLPPKNADGTLGAQPLRSGRNVIAVSVMPGTGDKESKGTDILMSLRLDAVPKAMQTGAEEVTEKLVSELAVVCDMCNTLRSGPACVSACPHEAAMRVDARFDFPTK